MQTPSHGGIFPQSFEPPEGEEICRRQGLVAACREFAAAGDAESVGGVIPRLSLGVCGGAKTAQLLELSSDGGVFVVAAAGSRSMEHIAANSPAAAHVHPQVQASLHALVRESSFAQPRPGSLEPVAVIPIPRTNSRRLLLVLERDPGRTFSADELSALEIFALMAAAALARAEIDAQLQPSRIAERALVGAVADAVVALDGIVRALSPAAGALVADRTKEGPGKRLTNVFGPPPPPIGRGPSDPCSNAVQLANAKDQPRSGRCDSTAAVTLTSSPGRAAQLPAARYHIDDLIGESPPIRCARDTAHRVAELSLPILITGETGTGKEILAQAIHNASARAAEPFIGVNVSATPGDLLESELFGYEPGAFTGAAAQGRAGKFELAQNGTLLLDEIGEMPLDLQTKLLRALQEKAVHRLGGSAARAFNARVIASTNRDLQLEVTSGRFRLDLLHRLRVVEMALPPLRDRPGDIRVLVEAQLAAHGKRLRRTIGIAPHVLAAFERYPWPGNVREPVKTLEAKIALLPPGKTEIDEIPEPIELGLRSLTPSGGLSLESAERRACARALEKAQGNVAAAAHILGVVKGTLYSKIRRYGLEPAKTQPSPARRAVAGSH